MASNNYVISEAFSQLNQMQSPKKKLKEDVNKKTPETKKVAKKKLGEELKIIKSMPFEPWSGATDTFYKISDAGLWDAFCDELEMAGYDEITETELNDLLWFEPEFCLSLVGLSDGEEVDESLKNTFKKGIKESRTKKREHKKLTESVKSSKKSLKEGFGAAYHSIHSRVQSWLNDGYTLEEAVERAIDDGLIYTEDILDLASGYGVLDMSEITGLVYERLYNELMSDEYDTDEYDMYESVKKSKGKKKLSEAPVYDLSPQNDSRKSFYGKAKVDTGDKNDKNKLYSYNTLVAEIKDGKPVVYGTFSVTTLRHIKEWLKQNGFKADSAKQIMNDYGAKNESLKESSGKKYSFNDMIKDGIEFFDSVDVKDSNGNKGTRYLLSDKLTDEQIAKLKSYDNVVVSSASYRYAPEIKHDSIIILKGPVKECKTEALKESAISVDEVAKFIEDSVETLKNSDITNCRYVLDNDLCLYVGYEQGFPDAEDGYEICAKIAERNDFYWPDFDFLDMPYNPNDGDVWDTEIVSPSASDAKWFIDQYEQIRQALDDGEIVLRECMKEECKTEECQKEECKDGKCKRMPSLAKGAKMDESVEDDIKDEVKDILENKVNELFAEIQNKHGVKDGGLPPELDFELEDAQKEFTNALTKMLKFQIEG